MRPALLTRAARPRYQRRVRTLASLAVAAALAAQPACYGSYSAFHAVHRWNGHVTDNKIANSAIHFGLWVVPVYELTLFADFFVFNTVEFLTGNPVFQ
jgi:hypothetical protein